MRRFISTCAIAVALAATAIAQDSTVKSKTKVKADDARVTQMTGCLERGAAANTYMLTGVIAATGKDLTVKSKTKTDVHRDATKVKSETKTDVDHGTVGTAGATAVYDVMGRDGVNLSSYVGQRVQITAVMPDPVKGSDNDADVKIKEKTKARAEDAPDSKSRSKTTFELPRGAHPRLTAVSITSIAPTCS